MKIATYNIWNSESGMPYRIKYIVNEIKLINADVICLQEVSSRNWLKVLQQMLIIPIGILIILKK